MICSMHIMSVLDTDDFNRHISMSLTWQVLAAGRVLRARAAGVAGTHSLRAAGCETGVGHLDRWGAPGMDHCSGDHAIWLCNQPITHFEWRYNRWTKWRRRSMILLVDYGAILLENWYSDYAIPAMLESSTLRCIRTKRWTLLSSAANMISMIAVSIKASCSRVPWCLWSWLWRRSWHLWR